MHRSSALSFSMQPK